MSTELRKTGISVVGDMPWGTHFCTFYETTQDLLDILVPYFKAGVENGEFSLLVISNSELLTVQEAISALRNAIPDLDRHLAERRIEIVGHDQWFLEAGAFDLYRVANRLKEKLDDALARGYVGMRVNGSPAWLLTKDTQELREFEQELDRLFRNERLIASCTYPLAESGAAELLDVARAHQFAIARRQGKWEVLETPELIQAKQEIQRLNAELEQRVSERTSELAATNEELRREIIERKRVENDLRKQKEILQKIFDHSPMMIGFIGADGHWEMVNRAWERTMGWTLEDIQKPNVDIFAEVYPDPRERQRVLDLIAATAGEWADFKARVRDGRVLDVTFANVRLSDGTTLGFGLDITERKRAEMALQQSEQWYRSLIEVSPDAIAQVDLNITILVVNQQTVTLLGYTSADEIVGHSAFEFIAPEDHERAQADLQQTLQAGTVRNLQYRLVQRGGRRITAELNAQLVVDSAGMPQAVIAVVRDITERKQVESERARLFAQLQLLSRQLLQAQETERRSLARELHDEIGQRLTGLGLLLSREHPSRDQLTDAQAVVRDLIARLRNLSLNLRPTILDDLGLLPALLWLFDRYTAQTNVTVRFEHRLQEEQRFPSEVETTTYRIVQEALTNVARYAGVSDVTVRLWTDDDTLWVVVADQGRGFDPQTIDTRASSGLAGMQERTALLGGSLTIEAESGRGTRLTLTLPLTSGESNEQEQRP